MVRWRSPACRVFVFSPRSIGLLCFCLALFFTACQTVTEDGSGDPGQQKEPKVTVTSEGTKREVDPPVLFNNLDTYAGDWRRASERMDFALKEKLKETLRDYVRVNFDLVEHGLTSEESRWREIAAGTIGFSGEKKALPLLMTLLDDESPFVRSNALLSLYVLGDKTTPVQPVAALLKDEDEPTRQLAALALTTILEPGREREGDCLFLLIGALDDENPYVRSHAARALGVLKRPEAVSSLVRALDDVVDLVRIRVALALGSIGDVKAVKPLAQQLTHNNPYVRDACLKALKSITGVDLGIMPGPWEKWFDARRVK